MFLKKDLLKKLFYGKVAIYGSLCYLKLMHLGSNLDKTFVWLSDPFPSHEILIEIYFVVKHFIKRFE